MANIDSISLAAQLVSLGLQVQDSISSYLSAVKSRDEDVEWLNRQVEGLGGVFKLIEASTISLSVPNNRPEAAVAKCLQSCQTDLQALESLIIDLADHETAKTSPCGRLQAQAKKLDYPFKRSRLQELQKRLCYSNGILQMAVQLARFDSMQLFTENLESVKSTSQESIALLSNMQHNSAQLNVPVLEIRDEVSEIHNELKSVEKSVFWSTETLSNGILGCYHNLSDQISLGQTSFLSSLNDHWSHLSRIENQNLVFHSKVEELDQFVRRRCQASDLAISDLCRGVIHGRTIEQLNAKPSAAKVKSEISKTRQDDPLANCKRPWLNCAMSRSTNSIAVGDTRLVCSCGATSQGVHKSVRWRSFDLYYGTSAKEHAVHCKAGQGLDGLRRRNTIIRYIGMNRVLKSAIKLSFAIKNGAGRFSISPAFTYYPTVDDSAPAFRVLDVIDASIEYLKFGTDIHKIQWQGFLDSAVAKILSLFQQNKASPFAVTSRNRSLIHKLAGTINRASLKSYDLVIPLLGVLKALILCHVPCHDYDISGSSPFQELTETPNTASLAATEIILQSLPEPLPVIRWTRHVLTEYRITSMLDLLASSEDIAEAYGCGPLSVAVLANDDHRVKDLIAQGASVLHERNVIGQTPLHLAGRSPLCLMLLLQATNHTLLDWSHDLRGLSPLDYALILSSEQCHNGSQSIECWDCNCTHCVDILCEADCAIPLPSFNFSSIFELCSYACKKQYVQSMKNRRERLREFACKRLSSSQCEKLDILTEEVLDSKARHVARTLHEQHIPIPNALIVDLGEPRRHYKSIYGAIRTSNDVEIFFRAGFRDLNPVYDGGSTLLASVAYWITPDIPYMNWLVRNGADLFCSMETASRQGRSLKVYSAHFVFGKIGYDFRNTRIYQLQNGTKQSIDAINSIVLPRDIFDDCQCHCSAEGCSPFIYMLRSMCIGFNDEPPAPHRISHAFSRYLRYFQEKLKLDNHFAAIRFLTAYALNIVHTCCGQHDTDHYDWKGSISPSVKPVESVGYVDSDSEDELEQDEVSEIDTQGLQNLEKLIRIFERELSRRLENHSHNAKQVLDFWNRYWVDRVQLSLAEWNEKTMSEDQRRGAEDLGLVWHDVVSRSSPVVKQSLGKSLSDLQQRQSRPEFWFKALDEV